MQRLEDFPKLKQYVEKIATFYSAVPVGWYLGHVPLSSLQ
jgi:hypothetical protein